MLTDVAAIERDLRERYPLGEREVALPGHRLRLLAAESSEEVESSESDADEPPFWAQIWDAGRALAGYVLRGPPPRGTVLELGAGVGLVGIAVALRGGEVIQTDRVVDAARAASVNAARCGVGERVRPVVADWRAWPLTGRFGLVLGADILYRVALHPALLATLRRTLVPGGTALLADPGRSSADLFSRSLLAHGWHVTEYPLPMPGRASPGRLIRALAP